MKFCLVDLVCSRVGKLTPFPASMVPIALCAAVLVGCSGPSVVRERPHLATTTRASQVPNRPIALRQSEPKCEFKPISLGDTAPNNSLTARLEYERRCFQQAELAMRHRAQALQISARETTRHPNNEPDCEFKPIGLGDTVDTVSDNSPTAKLEYERRCYQEAELTMRRYLRQLQISALKRTRHRHNHPQNNS
jgi:hypothetical protein